MPVYDVAILGGGPAGYSAAIYLGRLQRRVLLVERGDAQTSWPQVAENYLGFPRGIRARDLIARGRIQAKRFGTIIQRGEIRLVKKTAAGFLLKGDVTSRARTVVFCTGASPGFPVFPGWENYVGRSLFDCIICHAHTVRGRRVLVVGHDDVSVRTCLQLRRFTKQLTFLTNCESGGDQLSGEARARLQRSRIPIQYGTLKAVRGRSGMMRGVELDNGAYLPAEFIFGRQKRSPHSALAAALGTVIEGEGYIKVDASQRTKMARVYAAGDVCSTSTHQIISAAHQGAVAALSANEDLAEKIEKPW